MSLEGIAQMPSLIIKNRRYTTMSGKYMKIKRVIIPTLTMVLLSSMLFGCSAATKEETYDMLQQSTEIELEYAVPEYDTDEESQVELLPWIQLSSLETHPELRSAFEELLGIIKEDDGTKSGVVYTDENGDRNQNNTLYNALGNINFTINYIRDDAQQSKIEEIANNEYTDLEDNQSIPAVINAYFELLPDQADGQFDGSATISRAQAMTLLMRAITPVNEAQAPDEDADFTAVVGESQYTNFAAPMNQCSYLNTENGLTDKTFNTTMSRGEYIYMITNAIFNDDYTEMLATVGKEDESLSEDVKLTTVKDGGDISLQEAINNVENGLPTDMYNTLARAVALGFIDEDNLNWDEAITKSEAITLFIDAVDTYYTNSQVDYKYLKPEAIEGMNGNAVGDLYVPDEEDLAIEDEATLAQQEAQEADEQLQAESVTDYTVIAMDAQTMYAQHTVNLRQGPATTYEKVGSLSTNQSVTVTGYVETTSNKWYQLSTEEFVSAKYLGTGKVAVQAPSNSSSSNTGNSQSSDTDVYIIDGTGSGTRDGSSRENRSGVVDNWGGDGAITGGNLH